MIARLAMRPAMIALFAIVLGGVLGGVVRPVSAENPSPASLLIAKQIVEIKGVNTLFEPLVRGVVEKVKSGYLQRNFLLQRDLNEVAALMHKEYDSRSVELVDIAAQVYASHFTEQELKQILAFYQSPLGKKVVLEEPKALDESMNKAGDWGDSLAADVAARMRAEMKKRGHDI